VKILKDAGVKTVIAAEFGPGVSTLLDQHHVTKTTVHAGKSVAESIKDALAKVQKHHYEVLKMLT
jgi:predicted Fe-Mo cluster-binding NifX family protein